MHLHITQHRHTASRILLSAYLTFRGSPAPALSHCLIASPSFPCSESNKLCKVFVEQLHFHCTSRNNAHTRSAGDKPSSSCTILRRLRFIEHYCAAFISTVAVQIFQIFFSLGQGTCPFVPRGFVLFKKRIWTRHPPF